MFLEGFLELRWLCYYGSGIFPSWGGCYKLPLGEKKLLAKNKTCILSDMDLDKDNSWLKEWEVEQKGQQCSQRLKVASPSAGKAFPRSLPDAVVCSWMGTKAFLQDSAMWREDCKASYWSLRMMPSFWSVACDAESLVGIYWMLWVRFQNVPKMWKNKTCCWKRA